MSILIKNQDMPKEGEKYLLEIRHDGTVYDAIGQRVAAQAVQFESPWHRVEEEPPDGNEDAVIYYEWTGISGRVYRETSIISLNELIVLGRRPIAWMEKPEPQKEENEEGFVALAIKETERSEK